MLRIAMKKKISLFVSASLLIMSLAACENVEVTKDPLQESDAPSKQELQDGAALAEAEYPERLERPNFEEYFEKDGTLKDSYFEIESEWNKEKDQLKKIDKGSKTSYLEFMRQSSPVFLPSQKENQLYSPISLYLALGMLSEVTANDSHEQLLTLLGAENLNDLRKYSTDLWNSNYQSDGQNKSLLANSLWLRNDAEYKKDSLDNIKNHYFASSYSGTMGSKDYNLLMQDWVNKNTGNLLEEQVKELEFEEDTVLSLISTIYLKKAWNVPFVATNNTDMIFHGVESDSTTSFMRSTEMMPYAAYDNFEMIAKPHSDLSYTMFLLPKESKTPTDVINSEDFSHLFDNRIEDLNSKTVELSLPKFDVESQIDMRDGLKELGVTSIFTPSTTNFSSILQDDSLPLSVTKILQGARAIINEEGVEAAAYTQISVDAAGAMEEEIVELTFDRPFVFVICGLNGTPLFIGTVNQL